MCVDGWVGGGGDWGRGASGQLKATLTDCSRQRSQASRHPCHVIPLACATYLYCVQGKNPEEELVAAFKVFDKVSMCT